MWIYIVTWCLKSYVSDPCPDYYPNRVDEFGREDHGRIGCNVLHGHLENFCNYNKRFNDRSSAFIFYNKALKETKPSFWLRKAINNIKIDSTWTSQY